MVWVSGDAAAGVAVCVCLLFVIKEVVGVSLKLTSELVVIKALEAVSALRVCVSRGTY